LILVKSVTTNTIKEHTIIQQLEKICRSPELRSKKLLCDFLSYIVSEYLAGRGEMIKGYSVGVDVFGKDEDFDPGEDALVRIHAGRLRRMLDLYYLKSGRNDRILIEIPKGSYTPVISERKETKPSSGDSMNSALTDDPTAVPSVAVLPFSNLSGDPSEDFFSIGFSEELSLELTKYEDLTIFNCSTCKIREDSPVPNEIVQNKGIRFIVEGSVLRSTDQVKILAKLTDTKEGIQVWSERYVRELTANYLNEIQEHIAKKVANILGNEYGIIPQRLTLDAKRISPQQLDTYSAMLKYFYFLANQGLEDAQEAFTALEHALEKEPDSAIAKALLGSLYGNRYSLDYPDALHSYDLMGKLVEEAAAEDPNHSLIKVALIYKCLIYEERARFFNLVNQYLKMIRYNSTRMGSVAFHLSLYGDWERGKQLLDGIYQSGITYPLYFHGATTLYHYREHRYAEALAEANRYDMPSLFWGPMLRAAVHGKLHNMNEAQANIDQLLALKPDFEKKARYLISRFVKEEELVDQVMEGLREAGMSL